MVAFNIRTPILIACVFAIAGGVLGQQPTLTGTPAVISAVPASGGSAVGQVATADADATGPLLLDAGTYAVFHSSEGDFVAKLFPKQAPRTVQSFVDLAAGKKKWKHPVTGVESDRPLFNNTLVYRTIQDSMICGGDPINKGTGDAGFQLPVETVPELEFNQPGLLAMDVSGSSASSGSRWFITLRPFPDRNGQYAIFGKVAGGLGIVRKIANRPTKRPQLPLDPAVISSIEILEIPKGKQAAAQFETELGRDVLSVDSSFSDAPNAPVTSADAGIERPAGETSGTVTGTGQSTPTLPGTVPSDGITTAAQDAK